MKQTSLKDYKPLKKIVEEYRIFELQSKIANAYTGRMREYLQLKYKLDHAEDDNHKQFLIQRYMQKVRIIDENITQLKLRLKPYEHKKYVIDNDNTKKHRNNTHNNRSS